MDTIYVCTKNLIFNLFCPWKYGKQLQNYDTLAKLKKKIVALAVRTAQTVKLISPNV